MNRLAIRGIGPLAFAVAFAVLVNLMGTLPASAQGRPGNEGMPIAGGTAALLRQCRIPASVEPARAILVLTRAVHAATPASALSKLSPVAVASMLDAARRQGLPAEDVPALLPLAVWQSAVFGRRIAAEDLAAAILADARASLLYDGLFSLDDETLQFFVTHPALLTVVYRNEAAVFAAFAESITVRNGRVVLPGDDGAAPIWEDLVGAPAGEPERFIVRLLARDEGRVAWMFDTVVHLDTAHQDFALGRRVGPQQRREYVKAVYEVFAGFQRTAFPFPLRPFVRQKVDPPFVLATVAVTDDGRLAPPAEIAVWRGAFAVTEGLAAGEMTAPWLLQHVFTLAGRTRLDALLFAQRLFAAGSGAGSGMEDEALPGILSAFAAHQALMLALERLGFVEPRDYGRAVQTADALSSGTGLSPSLRAAMFQGALALLVRLHQVGTLDDKAAQGLARMLVALPNDDPPAYADGLLQWIDLSLMPALSGGRPAASMDAEQWLLDGLAGAIGKRPTPIVQWEDQSYRVDLAAAERGRVRQMLEKQRAFSLNMALDLRRFASRAPDSATAAALTSLLAEIDLAGGGTLFGFSVPQERDAILGDLRQMQRDPADSARLQSLRGHVRELLAVLLADILTAHVYALAIEDPDASLLLVDRPARAHQFAAAGGMWMPLTVSPSALKGSLLGFERAVALFSLRRTTLDSPPAAPVLTQMDVQGLAESAVALNPFRLTDVGRDAIAAALQQGRQRVAAVAGDPAALDALAAEVSVQRWRRRLMRWAAAREPDTVMRYLSLGEILVLGAGGDLPAEMQDWGVAQRCVDGSFAVRMPRSLRWHQMAGRLGAGLLAARVADLSLRVAESLAALKLPAALAHGVEQYATWDVIGNVQMADLDDWMALIGAVRSLTADQMADYVSALTADGPMVPVK